MCVKSIVANQQLGWLVSNYGFGKCIPGQRTTIAMVEASLWLNILDAQFNGRLTHNRLKLIKNIYFLGIHDIRHPKIVLEHHRSSTILGVLFSMYTKHTKNSVSLTVCLTEEFGSLKRSLGHCLGKFVTFAVNMTFLIIISIANIEYFIV